MATGNPIPEKIRNYNVYIGDTASQRLVGVSGEVTLPDIVSSGEEVSGAGLLGKYESPNDGHTDSMSMAIPVRIFSEDSLALAMGDYANVTLRAGTQSTDIATQRIVEQGLVINVRGPVKEIKPGKLAVGSPMDSEFTLEVLYFKISQNKEGAMKDLVELDKINFVYAVNGVDRLANLRRYI